MAFRKNCSTKGRRRKRRWPYSYLDGACSAIILAPKGLQPFVVDRHTKSELHPAHPAANQ